MLRRMKERLRERDFSWVGYCRSLPPAGGTETPMRCRPGRSMIGAVGRFSNQMTKPRIARWAAVFLGLGVVDESRSQEWPLDTLDHLVGNASLVPGVQGEAISLEGQAHLELPDSVSIHPSPDLTFLLSCNPVLVGGAQRMIAAKNRYDEGEREWGVMIDQDGKFRLYLWQGGWTTVTASAQPNPGHWHRIGVILRTSSAELWIDGVKQGETSLSRPIAPTLAPITLGGVGGETSRQRFVGALDEASFVHRSLSEAEMKADFRPTTATLDFPRLWDDALILPKATDLPVVEGARFSVIKPYEFLKDGYRFLHGVGLCFHGRNLYASFGHNRGGENTDTEEARFTVSSDQGRTWCEVKTIDAGEGPVGISHGSFLSHRGKLWAFMGAYTGTMQGIHTRAYLLDEASGLWQAKGTVIEGGFWPMQEPVPMEDGNWILAGITAGVYDGNGTHPAAVAISHGEDFTKWDLIPIPQLPGIAMWGESSVIVQGKRVTSISRFGAQPLALVAESEDYGRTWTTMRPSNLPMATSKPIAGLLSNGQRYLVCSSSADGGGRRAPLTVAVSKPGEEIFSKVFVIRHAIFSDGPGESHGKASLSYPYAIEHEGHLYVGYSNNGGNVGRIGEGRELWNNNSAELAVIPITSLGVD